MIVGDAKVGQLLLIDFTMFWGVAKVRRFSEGKIDYINVVDHVGTKHINPINRSRSTLTWPCKIITKPEYCEYVLGLREPRL